MADVFLWIEVRAFVHPTEQEDRVRKAIATVAPGAEVRAEVAEGHFGPPLVILSGRLEAPERKRAFWRPFKGVAGLPGVLDAIKDHVDDDCVLHLRLDKQRAFLGELAIVDHDDVLAVRAKVSAYPAKRNEAARIAKAYLAGL